jgi:type IX secretion system PorP/SprF family membrane protein
MNRLRLLVLLAVVLLGFMPLLKGQDPHFSQYYSNPLYMNPAYAGSAVCPRITVNFRMQWPSLPGKYTTYSASYDQYFKGIAGGIGVVFLGDRAGGVGHVNTNILSLIYSFKADLTRKVAMQLAVQVTGQQKTIDFSECNFGDMIDPRRGFIYATAEKLPKKTILVPDFSAGFVIYSDVLYGGIAVHHFTQPKESFFEVQGIESRLPIKFTGNFGAMIKLKQHMRKEKSMGDMFLSPNVIVQYQKMLTSSVLGSNTLTTNIGMYFTCYPMVLGTWVRFGHINADALIFLAGIEYKILRVGYSYDITLPNSYGGLKSGGAHEVSVQFNLPCPERSRRIRHINCPKF